MPGRKVLMAWSSGKDAAWALHLLRRAGQVEVAGLLTTVTETYGRVSMHGVREGLVQAQARAARLPLVRVGIPAPCPHEVYEEKMRAAMEAAKAEGVTRVVFGDILLASVREYRERQLARVGMRPLFPLWGSDTRRLAREMIAAGLGARVSCLDPAKVPRGLAGAEFDAQFLAGLPADVDPCGENGEFHTFCFAAPIFSAPIDVEVGETVEREGFVFTDLVPAGGGA